MITVMSTKYTQRVKSSQRVSIHYYVDELSTPRRSIGNTLQEYHNTNSGWKYWSKFKIMNIPT